jgi:hypothetical protein
MYRLTAYYFSYRRYLSGYRYLEMALQQDSEGFEDLYSHYPNSKKMTKVQELIKKYTNPA